ncbi:hypothetical protein D9M69_577860 [compost metagenome]
MAVGLEVHARQDADAGGGHHAEHHEARTAEHHGGQRLDQRGHLRQQAQHDQDHAAGHADIAALDAGDGHEAHVLREAGVREGVEDAADERAQAVGAQALGQVFLADLAVGHFAEREEHAG